MQTADFRADYRKRLIILAASSALSATLLGACTTNPAPRAEVSAGEAQVALERGRTTDAVKHAEAAVLAEPRSAHYRAMLGAAYLDAGRFASAATSFDDAVRLGDDSARTALSLSLALSGAGKQPEALGLLRARADDIPAADLGLAYALAGEPRRGVHVLTTAIRGGDTSVKARQNLAYAYALAGQWREARIMAAQDIPQDQVGKRMAEWAATIHPEAATARIAGLLGVPANAADGGQPVSLALSNAPGAVGLASGAAAYATPVAAADYPQATDLNGELMPVGADNGYAPAPVAAASPAALNSGVALAPLSVPAANAPIAPAPVASPVPAITAEVAESLGVKMPAPVVTDSARFTSNPVVQPTPRAAARTSRGADPAPAVASAPVTGGSHLVQLGSFSSEAGAKRAWGIYQSRYPELADREMVITEAVVRGKRYWRVSAGGYARSEAASMCGRVKTEGRACYAWSEGRPMPGAVDTGVRMARR
ncbi:SPOR domain-containing protein [Alteriqipengyuania flavescens]|uniref:SPOR domain-containing protein n=1 Tax=Alteriqipengyuania flavescens TaxID=3053610 RepID=UPI0025B42434|nr:SPOR domain-containing protein [Alteriqipengyuania flavescens]WJY17604.1 SPOR domain-containing protein [Alteriqipengyuania flavescens]WJY23547.1 SPOR domain-containing protein [Alteriqipengyuania flavescens]